MKKGKVESKTPQAKLNGEKGKLFWYNFTTTNFRKKELPMNILPQVAQAMQTTLSTKSDIIAKNSNFISFKPKK